MIAKCSFIYIVLVVLVETVHNFKTISKSENIGRLQQTRQNFQRNSTPHFTPTLRKPTKRTPVLSNFTSSINQTNFYAAYNSLKASSNKKCLINFCKNKGKCYGSISAYYCLCEPGYTGTNCEFALCESKFCKQRGLCIFKSNSKRECECFEPYYGEHCENIMNPKGASERFKNRYTPR